MGRSSKKQAKHAKKVLGFYRQAFGLERPYQLVLHGGFIQHCLGQKVFFREQLIELHDGPVTLHVTRDTRQELRKLGPSHDGAAVVCKRLINLAYEAPTDSEDDEDAATAHEDSQTPTDMEATLDMVEDESDSAADDDDSDEAEDEAPTPTKLSKGQRRRRALNVHKARERARLEEEAEAARHPDPAFAGTNHTLRALMRENPGQYILAVQDAPLRAQLRRIPGVPIVYVDKGSGMICFEQPSKASERWAARVEHSKQVASEAEQKLFGGQLVDILEKAAESQLKKRKQKGVNPLAAKKKQKKMEPAQQATSGRRADDCAETEVSVRQLRQRERQRRRVRQRVRHKRPAAEPVSTDGDDANELISGETSEEEDEDEDEEEEQEQEQEDDEADESSSADSASETDSGDDSQEDERATSGNVGEHRQQDEAWKQPLESLRCYCSLVPDTQLYGKGKRHFERGPTAKYPNRGRKFFCCGQGMAVLRTRCSYFAWAEPPIEKQAPKFDSDATLSDKLLQMARAEQSSGKGSSSSATKPATTMEDMKNLTPAAALRKLKKLDRQIAELAKKAADGAELTEDQKAKLGRENDVKKMLVDAEKAAVKAAFAAPQLVIRQAPQQPETEAEMTVNHGQVDGDKDGPAKEEATAATEITIASSSVPAPAAREGGFLATGAISGMDPVSIWYTAVANWIRSKPSGGTGLGSLGSAVPPPPGAPKLKKLILRAKHLRISPDGQVELME